MKKRSLLFCILLSVLILSALVACKTAPREIINISFSDELVKYSDMEEPFYEDEQYAYVFPAIMSYDCTVYYSDGSSENIVDALKAGRATPADLDRFDIHYFTYPISKSTE